LSKLVLVMTNTLHALIDRILGVTPLIFS